jgi:hypothetical protein
VRARVEVSAAELVARLAGEGVGLRPQGGGLVAWGPVGLLFRALAEARARRDELLAYFRSRSGAEAPAA